MNDLPEGLEALSAYEAILDAIASGKDLPEGEFYEAVANAYMDGDCKDLLAAFNEVWVTGLRPGLPEFDLDDIELTPEEQAAEDERIANSLARIDIALMGDASFEAWLDEVWPDLDPQIRARAIEQHRARMGR